MIQTQLLTERGYDIYELLSALQKDVRRGKEEQAMHWAVEVDNFLLTVYGDIEKGIRLEIPDYALDNHTARGKSKGRGVEFFIKEGTKLVNETMADPYKERAEKILKK